MKDCIKKNRIILIGVFIAIVVWPLDSLIDAHFIYDDELIDQLFSPSLTEIYFRSLFSMFFIAFAMYAQKMNNRLFVISEAQKIEISRRSAAEDELKEKVTQLENYKKLTVGRELKMIELKCEIDALLVELGREPKFCM